MHDGDRSAPAAHPSRLRHLGGGRAGRPPPADAAHLRAQGPRRPGPHRRRQPPLQRRRHRAAAPHPGAHQRGPQPGRRAARARARGRGGRAAAASSTPRCAGAQAAVDAGPPPVPARPRAAEPVRRALPETDDAELRSPDGTTAAHAAGGPRGRPRSAPAAGDDDDVGDARPPRRTTAQVLVEDAVRRARRRDAVRRHAASTFDKADAERQRLHLHVLRRACPRSPLQLHATLGERRPPTHGPRGGAARRATTAPCRTWTLDGRRRRRSAASCGGVLTVVATGRRASAVLAGHSPARRRLDESADDPRGAIRSTRPATVAQKLTRRRSTLQRRVG